MANCINKNLPEFKTLQEQTGINPYILAAKIAIWQEKNNSNEFPTIKDLNNKSESIYYNKTQAFEIESEEFKADIAKRITWDLINNKGWVSKDKHNGKHTIMHTYNNVSYSGTRTVEQRKQAVNDHYRMLNKLNERESNGEKPFIITKLNPTKDGIPNYSVEINEDYLDIEWEKLKLNNNLSDEKVDNGKVENNQLKLSFDKRHRLADAEGLDTIINFEEKVFRLQKAFNVRVLIDHGLDANTSGRYYPRGMDGNSAPEIGVNPNLIMKDVAIHEFGHLFLDLLGGTNNSFVKRGRELLRGSVIEKRVLELYKDVGLSEEEMNKEIMATAIGFEGAILFDMEKASPFKSWLKIFLNKLRLLLGMNGNHAMELANRLLNNEINRSELTGELSDTFQDSKTMNSQEPSSEEDSKMESLITKITDRILILKAKYDKTGNKKFKEDVGQLLKVLESHRDARGLIRYVDEVVHQTEIIEKSLKKMNQSTEPIDGQRLKNISTFLGAFELVDDVRTLLVEELDKAEAENNLRLVKFLKDKKQKLDLAKIQLADINSTYLVAQDKFLVELMTPYSNVIKHRKAKQYEKEFYAKNGRNNNKAEKDRYVKDKLAENAEEIAKLEKANVEKNIQLAPKDITAVESWVSDARNLDDNLIRTAVELLDKADYNAMTKFLAKRNEANAIWEELYAYKGNESNQKKLYEGIIEKVNGKETGHLVGKYLSTFKDAEREFWNTWNNKGERPPKQTMIQFYTKEKSKYINPQWTALKELDKSNPVRKMYDHLTATSAEKDLVTPGSYKLGLSIDKNIRVGSEENINEVTYRLPAIEKNTMERLYEQGIFTASKEGLRDIFVKDTSDIEFGEGGDEVTDANLKAVYVDERGKENQSVPIHYRGNIKKGNQQSFDLVGISLMDYNMISNFEEKTKVSYALEILESHSATRDIKIRKGGRFLINKIGSSNSSFVTVKGIESKSYKALNSIIQDRLYGISSVDMGDFQVGDKSVSINKLANLVMGWTGNTMLMFNTVAGGVNLLQGKYQNFLEGTASKHYSRADLRAAEALYIKDSADILKDVGHKIPSSKTNLLVEKFDAFADFSGLISKFSNDSKAKRLANTGTGHFVNHTGEHYIQSTVMYAVLNNIKIKDGQGKEIPLHEAYEKKGDTLVLKEGIDLGEDFEFNTSRKIKEVIKQLHGNYDSNNQAMIQRYVAGKFGFMLRKWMVVGTQRRWRGIRYATKSLEDRSDDDIAFNSILEQDMEGYYTTTARFLLENKNELAKLNFAIISGNWNELTDDERANIRKTIVDLSAVTLSLVASALLAGLAEDADDDDKEMYYTMAYLFRRHYSEISFYANPMEGMRILQTPAASLSMIEKSSRFLAQLTDPTETYVRGDRKGELKLKRRASQLFPVFSQLDRNIEDTYKWMTQ